MPTVIGNILAGLGRSLLVRNSLYEMLAVVISLVLLLIGTPYLLKQMGTVNYGLWIFARTILGMSGLLQLGIGHAVVRFGALYRERNDVDSLMRLIGTTIVFYSGIGIVAAGLLWAFSAPIARFLLTDNVITLNSGTQIIRLVAWGIPALLLSSVGSALPRAFTKHQYSAIVAIVDSSSALGLTILFANSTDILPVIMALVSAKYLTLIFSIIVSLRVLRGYRLRLLVDWKGFSKVFNFSLFVAVAVLGSQLYMMADRLVVSRTLGAEALAIYGIANSLSTPILAVLAALTSTFLPRVSALVAAEDFAHLRRLYYRAQFSLAGLVLLAIGAGWWIADGFVPWWVGEEIAASTLPLVHILITVYALIGLVTLSQYVLYGLGKAWLNALLGIGGGCVSLVAMVWASQWGLISLTRANFVYVFFVSFEIIYLIIWMERGGVRSSSPPVNQ